jgi:hypothetical protein
VSAAEPGKATFEADDLVVQRQLPLADAAGRLAIFAYGCGEERQQGGDSGETEGEPAIRPLGFGPGGCRL